MVDTNGAVLGIVRSPDAPIFGIDVSLQKARTGDVLLGRLRRPPSCSANPERRRVAASSPAARAFFANPAALTGQNAFTDRANGNVSRPYFPDGELGRPPGPFSRPIAEFNPFSTGLQSALVDANVAPHVGFVLGRRRATRRRAAPAIPTSPGRLANGIQIFPGSVPIYRGNMLVGGIGVSGDGIDQDDMISFLGLHNGGVRRRHRSTTRRPRSAPTRSSCRSRASSGVRLRYVNCPFNPFLGTNEQNVCQGK